MDLLRYLIVLVVAAPWIAFAGGSVPALAQGPPTSLNGQTPATGTFGFPTENDFLILEAHQIQTREADEADDGLSAHRESYRWRLFGDGRLELSPYPSSTDLHQTVVEPQVIEQLLQILEQLYDLPAHQTTAPPSQDEPFVSIHLDRYTSHDGAVAIDYLDAVIVKELEPFFEELWALRQWITLSDPGFSIWFSGNPWPSICRPSYRDAQGIRGPETTWCEFHRLRHKTAEGPFGDPETRELVREKMRQRLRNLPRGHLRR